MDAYPKEPLSLFAKHRLYARFHLFGILLFCTGKSTRNAATLFLALSTVLKCSKCSVPNATFIEGICGVVTEGSMCRMKLVFTHV